MIPYSRFKQFQRELSRELGMRASMFNDGKVMIHQTEFSPPREFGSLQAAIDSFARYLAKG